MVRLSCFCLQNQYRSAIAVAQPLSSWRTHAKQAQDCEVFVSPQVFAGAERRFARLSGTPRQPDHERYCMTIDHVAVVLNAKAGALLQHAEAAAELQTALTQAGFRAEFIADEAPLPVRIARAARSGAGAVIVAGGDGTIARAAQQLAGGDIPLGILPFGTMNLLARDLHLPIGDIAAAIAIMARGQTRRIDVGDVNGHVFLCASMLGLPARLGRYREGSRGAGWLLWLRMARAALRLLIRGAPVKGTLEVASTVASLDAMTLTVTVNAVAEASGLEFSRARLDGGTLGLYAVRPVGLAGFVGLALRVASGQWLHDEAVQETLATAATVSSRARAMQVMNDGEISLLKPPLQYGIRPGGLLVLAP
jgi:diacylglycerol kinase family enzyme